MAVRPFNAGFNRGGMGKVRRTSSGQGPRVLTTGAGGLPGGGGGGQGTNSVLARALAGNFTSAFDAANKANQERFDKGLAERGALRTRSLDAISTAGEQERKDTEERFENLKTRQTQDLISRGLRGSTVAPTVEQGAEREKTSALGRLSDRLTRERVGTDIALTQDIEGFRERRQDVAPDMGMFLSLMEKLGGQGGNLALNPQMLLSMFGGGAGGGQRRAIIPARI